MVRFSSADDGWAPSSPPFPHGDDTPAGHKRVRTSGPPSPSPSDSLSLSPYPHLDRNRELVLSTKKRRENENAEEQSSCAFFDLETLDCNICMEPLSSPIFQCCNGHYACQACIAKMKEKCPTCSEPIGKNIRNLGLEKIAESLKLRCKFSHMGCVDMLSHKVKKLHEQKCGFSPCECPVTKCSFYGRVKDFSLHFVQSHDVQTLHFTYGQWFSVSIQISHLLLQAEDELFLLHNNKQGQLGNTLYVTVLDASQVEGGLHAYSMKVMNGRRRVELESVVQNSSSVKAEPFSTDFLLVPTRFMACETQLKVDLYICRLGESFPSPS